eukprot:GEZU01024933.1.p1 GENE.GEZU01024933.1~~GEZU01024933.1.p1  ORF type:complete len:165 (+),score=54.04 GEZU01024933.1:504-998(+)
MKIEMALKQQQQQPSSPGSSSAPQDTLLNESEMETLQRLTSSSGFNFESPLHYLRHCLTNFDWFQDPAKREAMRPILMRLCARYLYLEKQRDKALDPVANFHVRNGASMYRLNWMGDTSPKGLQQSGSIMVNYRYRLEDIERNNQMYVLNGVIAAEDGFKQYLQ